MVDINEVFNMLDSNSPQAIQEIGIQYAKSIRYFSILFRPVENKGIWENCAKVICTKTDDELKGYYLWKMFEWLQDMNWPGASIIYDRICEMNAANIVSDYIYSIKRALHAKDGIWLNYLAGFIGDMPIYDLLPPFYQSILVKRNKNFWGNFSVNEKP